MQTIHCYVLTPPAVQDIRIYARTLNGSLALFVLYVDGHIQQPDPPGDGGFSTSCSWTVARSANPLRCDVNVLPGQGAGQSSDAQISVTQSGHVIETTDNNNNQLAQPVRVKGTASGGDGVAVIYLNYHV